MWLGLSMYTGPIAAKRLAVVYKYMNCMDESERKTGQSLDTDAVTSEDFRASLMPIY